jgi:hypothetical protein
MRRAVSVAIARALPPEAILAQATTKGSRADRQLMVLTAVARQERNGPRRGRIAQRTGISAQDAGEPAFREASRGPRASAALPIVQRLQRASRPPATIPCDPTFHTASRHVQPTRAFADRRAFCHRQHCRDAPINAGESCPRKRAPQSTPIRGSKARVRRSIFRHTPSLARSIHLLQDFWLPT